MKSLSLVLVFVMVAVMGCAHPQKPKKVEKVQVAPSAPVQTNIQPKPRIDDEYIK